MGKVLLNRKVLVTRPEQQAEKICNMIENEGGIALRFPVQTIVPVPASAELHDRFTHLADYRIGIFVSANAVRHALSLLNYDTSIINTMTVFAVGKATADVLQEAGIASVMATGKMGSSEHLLQLPELQSDQVSGKPVIIFRGEGGREHLFNELKARGAEPDYAEVYRRMPVHYEKAVLDHLWTVQKPDVILISSNEGLQALVDMQTPEHRVIMQKTDLVVLSQRAAGLALALGFSKAPCLAGDTSDSGLLDALCRWANAHER